jgi:hypothetical protein
VEHRQVDLAGHDLADRDRFAAQARAMSFCASVCGAGWKAEAGAVIPASRPNT